MGICCVSQGTQTRFCINLEGWDGEGLGVSIREGIYVYLIPGTGEPGGLPSMGSHRVGHN